MTYLSGWLLEDLARAHYLEAGFHVHVARPNRRRHQRGHVVEYEQTFDLFGCFDLCCVHPKGELVLVQVTRNGEAISDKMKHIVSKGPWPTTSGFRVELWHWKDSAFERWNLSYEDDNPRWHQYDTLRIPDPKRMIARADTSLD